MIEFNNRIAAQRLILKAVNRIVWDEELFGLSKGAIDRWVSKNALRDDLELVLRIERAAEKLFFLSNKSQEQVTEEYQRLSADVAELTRSVEASVAQYAKHIGMGKVCSN